MAIASLTRMDGNKLGQRLKTIEEKQQAIIRNQEILQDTLFNKVIPTQKILVRQLKIDGYVILAFVFGTVVISIFF